jgi:hypothetical protein
MVAPSKAAVRAFKLDLQYSDILFELNGLTVWKNSGPVAYIKMLFLEEEIT